MDQKAIRAQALFVDPVIPPIPHRPTGNELFNLVAKPHSRQIRAIFEGLLINHPDGRGYADAYQCASFECILLNHLQSIVENRSRQPPAITECLLLDRPDGGGYVCVATREKNDSKVNVDSKRVKAEVDFD